MTGSLALAAEVRGERTRLARIRYDGSARCSRAFDEGRAARVVTSMLGPGYLAGDAAEIHGVVDAGARLIVADQSATRIYGGRATSSVRTAWRVGAGASLALLREPTTLFRASWHEAHATIDLAMGARAIVVDCVAPAEADFASYAATLEIRCDGQLVVADRARLVPATFPARAIGTLIVVGALRDGVVRAIEMLLDAARGVRSGVGRPIGAGIVVRAYGDDAWNVCATLHAIAALVLGE